jgi:acid phosphatase type 7
MRGRASLGLFGMLALLVALVPARADAGSATLTAIADAYVNASTPTSNYGTRTAVRIDGSPILNTYLKFDLAGVGGSITTATLSIYANSSNSAGFNVSTVADTSWDELAITYSGAPPIGTVVGSSWPVRAGTRIDVDVTAAVTVGAVVSLAMTETSSTAVSFGSRESATPPQLMVETDGATTTTSQSTTSQTTTVGAPTTTTSQTTASTPTTTDQTTTSPSTDPVVAAAGDIACDPANGNFNGGLGTSNACRQLAVSNLMVGNPDLRAVLVLGDNQYYCGGYQAFLQSYDLSWGRLRSTTHPVVGNHEYLTSGGTDCNAGNAGAAGYFTYFGAAAGTPGQGWYSFDVGGAPGTSSR